MRFKRGWGRRMTKRIFKRVLNFNIICFLKHLVNTKIQASISTLS